MQRTLLPISEDLAIISHRNPKLLKWKLLDGWLQVWLDPDTQTTVSEIWPFLFPTSYVPGAALSGWQSQFSRVILAVVTPSSCCTYAHAQGHLDRSRTPPTQSTQEAEVS